MPVAGSISPDRDREGGYASLTALLMCVAVSLLCGGVLTLGQSERVSAERTLVRQQQSEAINTAVMMAARIIYKRPTEVFTQDIASDGGQPVQLRAEPEALKWPLGEAADVTSTTLAQRTHLSRDDVLSRIADPDMPPVDDCVRSLFSSVGYLDTSKARSEGGGILWSSQAIHDGEVWRIRAVLNNRVEEWMVRFTGDPLKIYAIISIETYNMGDMPSCRDLI